MAATRVETAIAENLEEGYPHAAIVAYYRLAKNMMGEAVQAMTEATVLDMDMIGAALERVMEQAAAQYRANTGKPLFKTTGSTTSESD